MTDLSPYLQDDYVADLRLNSSQQGEDNGGLPSKLTLEVQINQGSPHFPTKVQERTHILLRSKTEGPEFNSAKQPSFVYKIN